jgi:hypothetical protein
MIGDQPSGSQGSAISNQQPGLLLDASLFIGLFLAIES